jgi:hypothetical protein
MLTRQTFLRAAVGLTGTSLALPLINACSPTTSETYPDAVQRIWHPAAAVPTDQAALQRELVRYATLAPSGHNTQCWKFHLEPGSIGILPDLTRRTPVVDPDDHHLYVSLGCALENLAQASLANGLKSLAQFDGAQNTLSVRLDATTAVNSPLFQAITERQCSRGPYDGRPLSSTEFNTLELAGTGNGVRVVLFTDKPEIEKLLELVLEGNTAQVTDPAFIKELKHWLRFGASEAVLSGDGLYSATSGNPSVPRWMGSPMFDIMFSAKSENDKYADQVRSSAGVAVFVSELTDKAHWIETGRYYERFALQATALGIRNAMLNQAVEVPAQRQKLANFLGLKAGRPDLVVRFGRGAKMPQSLRRRVEDVLI